VSVTSEMPCGALAIGRNYSAVTLSPDPAAIALAG
jgi:hypothetical protein